MQPFLRRLAIKLPCLLNRLDATLLKFEGSLFSSESRSLLLTTATRTYVAKTFPFAGSLLLLPLALAHLDGDILRQSS